MTEHDFIPDDIAYSNLIEELLVANLKEEAFSLYIHVNYNHKIIFM